MHGHWGHGTRDDEASHLSCAGRQGNINNLMLLSVAAARQDHQRPSKSLLIRLFKDALFGVFWLHTQACNPASLLLWAYFKYFGNLTYYHAPVFWLCGIIFEGKWEVYNGATFTRVFFFSAQKQLLFAGIMGRPHLQRADAHFGELALITEGAEQQAAQ